MSTVTVEKTPSGAVILHMPNGSTKVVQPGDTGTLPDGTRYVINKDGSITFTTPDGKTDTVNPDNGTTHTTSTKQ